MRDTNTVAWRFLNQFSAKLWMVCLAAHMLAATLAQANPGDISTVAGNGSPGTGGDGGPAVAAQLGFVSGIAVDNAGNLFLAGGDSHIVRRVDKATGIISRVAGTGTPGFSGDGGPAVSALLHGATDVALDAAGNLFIADQVNNRVRRVDAATQVISTVAGDDTPGSGGDDGNGGLATAAQLLGPVGLAIDSGGNLFISEINANRIRRVDGGTQIITTLVNGLNSPENLVADAAGNVFVADSGSGLVKRITPSGVVTVVAGGGSGGDGGFATNAGLDHPRDVAVDLAGYLYIAEQVGHRVRRVDFATKKINTIAGDGTLGFSGDGGPATSAQLDWPVALAFDSEGNLFVSDMASNPSVADTRPTRVRKIENAALPPLDGPESVAVFDDTLYVVAANSAAVFIYKRDPSTGLLSNPQVVREKVTCTNCLTGPGSLVVSPDGKNVYVANSNGPSAIVAFTRNLGGALSFKQIVQNGVGGVSGLAGVGNSGFGLAMSPDGAHLYAAGSNDHTLVVFARMSSGDLAFKQKKTNGLSKKDGLKTPYGVTVGPPPGREVYLTDFTDPAVAVYARNLNPLSAQYGFLSFVKGYTTTHGAFSVSVHPLGDFVYVAEPNGNFAAVYPRVLVGSTEGQLKPSSAAIPGAGAYQMAVSPGPAFAHLYVPNAYDHSITILHRDAAGALTVVDTVSDATVHCLDYPDSVAFSADGRFVYVAALGHPSSIAAFSRVTDPASVDYGKLNLIQCVK